MTLNEFKALTKEEVGQRINVQLLHEQHSTKESMEANGYDFSWTSMKKVAEERGLIYGFFDPSGEVANASIRDCTPVNEIIIDLDRIRDKKSRRPITFDKEVTDKLDSILINFRKDADRGKVYDVIFRLGLDALLKAFCKGKVKIVRNVPELNWKSNS